MASLPGSGCEPVGAEEMLVSHLAPETTTVCDVLVFDSVSVPAGTSRPPPKIDVWPAARTPAWPQAVAQGDELLF